MLVAKEERQQHEFTKSRSHVQARVKRVRAPHVSTRHLCAFEAYFVTANTTGFIGQAIF
jgi:hypothetical protein